MVPDAKAANTTALVLLTNINGVHGPPAILATHNERR